MNLALYALDHLDLLKPLSLKEAPVQALQKEADLQQNFQRVQRCPLSFMVVLLAEIIPSFGKFLKPGTCLFWLSLKNSFGDFRGIHFLSLPVL